MFTERDQLFMARALKLAEKAEGRTSPNPLVGCVIVKDEQIVGEGFHQRAGTPHAEIHALRAAGELAVGSTVYVNLEPCSHYGCTPPCAEALVQAGVKRVVVAMMDPNPLVSGAGIKRLREAGIQVDVGLLEREAKVLNELFVKAITTGMPFVTYKAALTLDGKIATLTGDSKWISNEKSRAYAHKLRKRHDVVMVGSETILKDNPLLTCRIPGGRDPVRVVVDGALRIPLDANVLTSSPTAGCIIATSMAAPKEKLARLTAMNNVEVIQYPTERFVPLSALMKDLHSRGYNGVLLEGGSKLAGIMMRENLIDKVEFFLAPKLLGTGISPFAGFGFEQVSQAQQIYDWQVSLATGDIHVQGYLSPDFARIKG